MCVGEVHRGWQQGSLRERYHLVDVHIDGRILKWLVKKWDGGHGLAGSCSGQGHIAGCCEFNNEPPGFIKRGVFPD